MDMQTYQFSLYELHTHRQNFHKHHAYSDIEPSERTVPCLVQYSNCFSILWAENHEEKNPKKFLKLSFRQ